MNAPAAARCCGPSRVTAACSAPTAPCLVLPSRRVRHRHAVRFKQKDPRVTAEIRPGIHRPDWSVVTKPRARRALLGRDRSRFGLADKWNQTLEPEQDRVWRMVLELFSRSGRPPRLDEIAKETRLSVDDLRTLIAELQAHDLVGMDCSADAIAYAYPFTGQETEHCVQLRDRQLHAVCAIDALGIAGMFHTDAVIESSCRACGRRIEIGTAQSGKSLSHAQPVDAVVWYDLAYSGRAVASCCPSIAFFCSNTELRQWLSAQSPQRAGYWLTLDEALEVGRALFEPVLAAAKPH
jgi:alkylmercury lyase